MKITFGASGSAATASRSSRSQLIVSTPASSSTRAASREENRETAMTRRRRHRRGASSHARERRTHLAAGTEDDDVAGAMRERFAPSRRAASRAGRRARLRSRIEKAVLVRYAAAEAACCAWRLMRSNHRGESDFAPGEADAFHDLSHEIVRNRERRLTAADR